MRLSPYVLAALCAIGVSSCTHTYSHSSSLHLRDTEGNAISGADIYLLSAPMYPLPLPWLLEAWGRTLDIQNAFHQTSDEKGLCQVNIPAHSTFYNTEDFYLLVRKAGFYNLVVPLSILGQKAELVIPSQQVSAMGALDARVTGTGTGAPSVLIGANSYTMLDDFQRPQVLISTLFAQDAEMEQVLFFPPLFDRMEKKWKAAGEKQYDVSISLPADDEIPPWLR